MFIESLNGCVDLWLEIRLEAAERDFEPLVRLPNFEQMRARRMALHRAEADGVRPHLQLLLESRRRSAAELQELAERRLSPGGVHDAGLLARIIYEDVDRPADSELLAAMIRTNWDGGKVGFQFLPDPAICDAEDYKSLSRDLINFLVKATNRDTASILCGEDLEFFHSLPDRFTVYRGASAISADLAAHGLCWTTQRNIADWFAERSAKFCDGDPIVMSARISKREVAFVRAGESEIVVLPRKARQIKHRRPRSPVWGITA